MDFRQSVQPSANRQAVPAAPAPEHKEDKKTESKAQPTGGKLMRLAYSVMLIGIVVLLAAIVLGIARGNSGNGESGYVMSNKYQAVFLTNGQVYFGNITSLNSKYLALGNVYYLTQSSAEGSTSSNYSLIKLGCQQIHDPYDQMVINRDQVSFWENLNADGKVVQSINEFKKQNPNGPDCSQVSSQTQASGTTTQSSNNSSSATGTNSSTTGANSSSNANNSSSSNTNSSNTNSKQ